MDKRLYVGIDIAKRSFDVGVRGAQGAVWHASFDNEVAGFEGLALWLGGLSVAQGALVVLTMEATGVYWEALAFWAVARGWRVCVVNPLQISAYARCVGQRNKTDKLDALLLARFGERECPPFWAPPEALVMELRALLREVRHIKKQLGREVARLQSAPLCVQAVIAECVAFWQGALARVQAQVMAFIEGSTVLKARARLLLSVPGVGEKTVPFLLAYLGDGSGFESAKKVASFAGLAPKLHESGTSVRAKARIGSYGKAVLREALFMPALVVSFGRYRAFVPFVERLLASGKRRKEIVIAVMRKILTVAYGVLKSGKPYDKMRHAV